MSLELGSVSVDAEGNVTGSGVTLVLCNALLAMPKLALMIAGLDGDPRKATNVQGIADLATAIALGIQPTVSLRPELEVTSARSFQLTDVNYTLAVNWASNTALTIDADATTNFPAGSKIEGFQRGAGSLVITPAMGVTLEKAETAITRRVGALWVLVKLKANHWVAGGDVLLV